MDSKLGEEGLEERKEKAGRERRPVEKYQIEWVWTPKEVASAGYEREDAVELVQKRWRSIRVDVPSFADGLWICLRLIRKIAKPQ